MTTSSPFSPLFTMQKAIPVLSFILITLISHLLLSSIMPTHVPVLALALTLLHSRTTNQMHLILFLLTPDVLLEGQRIVGSITRLKLRCLVPSNNRNAVVVRESGTRGAPV